MPPTPTRQEELRFEAEKKEKYKGTACIRLEWLHFGSAEARELDIKNVDRLKQNFRKDCDRLNAKNHILAVISKRDLDTAIQISGITEEALLTDAQSSYPELAFWVGYQLECLQGRHRIQAAKEALSLTDKWWTVDLYLAGVLEIFSSQTTP